MLQDVALGRAVARRLHPPRRARPGRGDPRTGGALAGKRVLHVSATAFGGGVSEILYTLVPLMRDVGLDVHWRVIMGREEFFNVTKLMHNSLQGDPQRPHRPAVGGVRGLQRDERAEPRRRLGRDHRPRPAAGGAARQMPPIAPEHWIWRCHIDLSTPNQETLGAAPATDRGVRRASGTWSSTSPTGSTARRRRIVPPAIDPLSPKNMALSPEDASFVCDQFGIDVDRPLICQVSRFDPWKDPMGVIDAYRLVTRGDARGPARAGGLDGDRRSRGLGVLPPHLRVRGLRPRHQDPQQPQQRRRDRGERVPVPGGRRTPEVDPGGVRPHRDRIALEGAPDDRPETSAESRCRSSTARTDIWSPAPSNAPSARSRSSATPSSASASAGPERSAPASASSAPGSCSTGCGSSGISTPDLGRTPAPGRRG